MVEPKDQKGLEKVGCSPELARAILDRPALRMLRATRAQLDIAKAAVLKPLQIDGTLTELEARAVAYALPEAPYDRHSPEGLQREAWRISNKQSFEALEASGGFAAAAPAAAAPPLQKKSSSSTGFKLNLSAVNKPAVGSGKPVAVPHTPKDQVVAALDSRPPVANGDTTILPGGTQPAAPWAGDGGEASATLAKRRRSDEKARAKALASRTADESAYGGVELEEKLGQGMGA